MIIKPYQVPPFAPLHLGFYPEGVMAPQSPLKSLSHISRYMIMEYALQNGFDDCLTLAEKETVLETAFGNVFWIVDNMLYTPSPDLPLHFGVSISVVLEIAHTLGLTTRFLNIPFSQIPEKAFLYRCNTMSGIRPIARVEKKGFQRNLPLEEHLLRKYEELLMKESSPNFFFCHQ